MALECRRQQTKSRPNRRISTADHKIGRHRHGTNHSQSPNERCGGRLYLRPPHSMKAHITPMPTAIVSPTSLNGVHENKKRRRFCCQDSIFNDTQYQNTAIPTTRVMSSHQPGRCSKTNIRGIARGALIAIRSVKEGGGPGMSAVRIRARSQRSLHTSGLSQ